MFWIVFSVAITLMIVIILIIDRKNRTDFYAEIDNERTTIRDKSGKILLTLTSQLVLISKGKNEEIIAVGKQGEVGFSSAHALPSEARIINLTNLSSIDSENSRLLWRTYLIYCKVLALQETYGVDHNIDSLLGSCRLFIQVEHIPAQIKPLFKKSIFGWLLGSPFILPK